MQDQSRERGLDLIKAVCIVLVVIWHLQPVRPEMLPDSCIGVFWIKELIRFFYQDISLIAVPSFILVSLYLFISKLSINDGYWEKRFLRLLQIYVFWVGIQFILYLLLGGVLPLPLKTIFRSGGPDLPMTPAIPSIFYYIYILILCTVLTFIFLKLPGKIKLTVSVIVIGVSCVYFFLSPLYGIGVDTRSMRGYYIYIPIAYYLNQHKDKFVRYRWLFFIGFALSVLYEWLFSGTTSAYARLPVLFGVLTFASFFISGWTKASRLVLFLSTYSLGIFALHTYWMAALLSLFSVFCLSDEALLGGGVLKGISLFILTFSLACISVYLLGKTKLRTYVS